MQANAFFPCAAGDPDEYTDDNPFNLEPFPRQVSDTEPARGLVAAILEGPEEADVGAFPLDTAFLTIGMITILKGICRVSLQPVPEFDGFISDLSRLVLREAITRTLMPFKTIDRVVVSVEM
jgi:hypothetical protein